MMETDKFVICVNDADFGDFSAADLIVGKCYAVLGHEDDWLRIIDESGKDYLYPSTWFVPVTLSREAATRLQHSLERAVA
ncbi:MAG: hypothetical protein H6973_19400 [Gammaproteobacteria bacterium]|nr:hypothetical protein [Gammaproteobacteria bacterium]